MQRISYVTSLLTFYLKGEIWHEQNFIKLKTPNTILSVIPLGAKNETIPVDQIASVETNFKLLFKNFIIGVILAILAMSVMGEAFFGGLILLLIGAGMAINAFQIQLDLNLTSGADKLVSFLIFEKEKAEQAAAQINGLIAGRMDDTNVRVHTERQTDVLVDAIQSLKK